MLGHQMIIVQETNATVGTPGEPTNGEGLGAMAPSNGQPNGCSYSTINLATME